MKKHLFVILSVFSLSALADMRSELRAHQKTLGGSSSASGPGGATVPKAGVVSTGQDSSAPVTRCTEERQTSLPLSTFLDYVLDPSPKLNIDRDPRSGIMTVSAPDMIGNCGAMLEWKLKGKKINDKQTYAIEIQFKKGAECRFVKDAAGADTTLVQDCKYKVTKKAGDKITNEDLPFEPSLSGFKACMADSGVFKDGKLNEDAIYPEKVSYPFENVKESGDVVFVSHGQPTVIEKAAYDGFIMNDGCDYFEKTAPQLVHVLSAEEEDANAINAQAEGLKNCPIEELQKLTDFLERNPAFSDLSEHRIRLLTEAAKASAKKITSGSYTDEDLSVIDDFQKYIIQENIEKLKSMYNMMANMPAGAQKTQLQTQINTLKAQLAAYLNPPYFSAANISKLVEKGSFDAAEKLYGLRAVAAVYSKLGTKINNVDITPTTAEQQISQARVSFGVQLETEKQKYEIRTGQTSGQSAALAQGAQSLLRDVQTRTQNYNQEMASEMQRQSTYCRQYWINAQKCIAESQATIVDLQKELKARNDADNAQASQFMTKAKEYEALEAQGKKYLATQNGEPAPVEDRTRPSRSTSSTTPDQNQSQTQMSAQQQQAQAMLQYQQQQMQQSMQQWQMQQQSMQGMSQYPQIGMQQTNPYMQQTNPYMQQTNPYMQQTNPYMQQTNPYMMGSTGMSQMGYTGGLNFGAQFGATSSPFGAASPYSASPYGASPYGASPYGASSPYSMGNYNLYGTVYR